MNNNGNLPAYPQSKSCGDMSVTEGGLSKLEEFAARFMAAWIIHHWSSGDYGYSSQAAALGAIQDADALLAELEKQK